MKEEQKNFSVHTFWETLELDYISQIDLSKYLKYTIDYEHNDYTNPKPIYNKNYYYGKRGNRHNYYHYTPQYRDYDDDDYYYRPSYSGYSSYPDYHY